MMRLKVIWLHQLKDDPGKIIYRLKYYQLKLPTPKSYNILRFISKTLLEENEQLHWYQKI